MAVGSLKRSSLTAYAKYDSMLAGNTFTPTTFDYEHLGTVELTGNQAAVTINLTAAMPLSYKHLQLRMSTQYTTGDQDLKLSFNGDTGASYSMHYLVGGSTNLVGGGGTFSGGIEIQYNWSSATFNPACFVVGITDILDYASSTKFKTIRSWSGVTYGASGRMELKSGSWRSASPITSMTLTSYSGGQFISGSRFSLYGTKG